MEQGSIGQHYFNRCSDSDEGCAGRSGYQTRAKSPLITCEIEETIKNYCRNYKLPSSDKFLEMRSEYLTQEEIDSAPVAYKFYRINKDFMGLTKTVLAREQITRMGNFFSHTLVLPNKYLESIGYNPFPLIENFPFKNDAEGCNQKLEDLSIDSDELKYIGFGQTEAIYKNIVEIRNSVVNYEENLISLLNCLFDFNNPHSKNKPIIINFTQNQDYSSCLKIIKTLFFLIPAILRARLCFSSYERNPDHFFPYEASTGKKIICTIPRSDGGDKDFNYSDYSNYYLLTLPEQRNNAIPIIESVYSNFIFDAIRNKNYESIQYYNSVIDDLNLELDINKWSGIKSVIELKNNKTADAIKTAIISLTHFCMATEDKAKKSFYFIWDFLYKNYTELDSQSYDITISFISKILKDNNLCFESKQNEFYEIFEYFVANYHFTKAQRLLDLKDKPKELIINRIEECLLKNDLESQRKIDFDEEEIKAFINLFKDLFPKVSGNSPISSKVSEILNIMIQSIKNKPYYIKYRSQFSEIMPIRDYEKNIILQKYNNIETIETFFNEEKGYLSEDIIIELLINNLRAGNDKNCSSIYEKIIEPKKADFPYKWINNKGRDSSEKNRNVELFKFLLDKTNNYKILKDKYEKLIHEKLITNLPLKDIFVLFENNNINLIDESFLDLDKKSSSKYKIVKWIQNEKNSLHDDDNQLKELLINLGFSDWKDACRKILECIDKTNCDRINFVFYYITSSTYGNKNIAHSEFNHFIVSIFSDYFETLFAENQDDENSCDSFFNILSEFFSFGYTVKAIHLTTDIVSQTIEFLLRNSNFTKNDIIDRLKYIKITKNHENILFQTLNGKIKEPYWLRLKKLILTHLIITIITFIFIALGFSAYFASNMQNIQNDYERKKNAEMLQALNSRIDAKNQENAELQNTISQLNTTIGSLKSEKITLQNQALSGKQDLFIKMVSFAEQAFKEKRYSDAIDNYRKSLEILENNFKNQNINFGKGFTKEDVKNNLAESYFYLAEMYYKKKENEKDNAEALSNFENAKKIYEESKESIKDSLYGEILYKIGLIQYYSGKPDNSKPDFKKLDYSLENFKELKKNKSLWPVDMHDGEIPYYMGSIYFYKRKYSEALKNLVDACKQLPENDELFGECTSIIATTYMKTKKDTNPDILFIKNIIESQDENPPAKNKKLAEAIKKITKSENISTLKKTIKSP